MWALWFVLSGATVMALGAMITRRRQRAALAQIGDLEATLDRFGVGREGDRYEWIPVLATRNLPWQSTDDQVAVAQAHRYLVEVRQGLGSRRRTHHLPNGGWRLISATSATVTIMYRRPVMSAAAERPKTSMLVLRPEQLKMLPDMPRAWHVRRGTATEVDVRSGLVGMELAPRFGVTVSSDDVCVPALARGVDGRPSERLVVGHGESFTVWGPGATPYGRFSMHESRFGHRFGRVRLTARSTVAAADEPGVPTLALELRPEHAMAIRTAGRRRPSG
ncbi:MAG: hypothetical protein AAGA90_05960 [Actinomycetota bacterium]